MNKKYTKHHSNIYPWDFLYDSEHIIWQNVSYHDQNIQLTLSPGLVFD